MYVPDLRLGSIPFKIVSMCSDTPIPAPLPLLERVLEVQIQPLWRLPDNRQYNTGIYPNIPNTGR